MGSVELTKNADPDKYICSGNSTGFDSGTECSFTDEWVVKNVIIFRADMSWYVHLDNKNKDILILGKRPTQGLDATKLTKELKYPANFTQSGKRICIKSTLWWKQQFFIC